MTTQQTRFLQLSSFLAALFLSTSFMVTMILPTFSYAQSTPTPSSPTSVTPPGSTASPGGNGVGSGCPGGWRNLTKPIDCLLMPAIVAVFGVVVMGFSGMVLEFAGYLFDLLVSTFVVGFAATLGGLGMVEGIHTGWTVLRDISNIVIIGMFTFIAISIIIGNHTFGEKKLVAKVLVVAILINFSLLFAKIIIDASNFVAWQVYKSMAPPGSGDGVVRSVASGTEANISGKFLSLLQATSLWDVASNAWSVTSNSIHANNQAGSAVSNLLGWSALKGVAKGIFFVLIASALLLAAAGVLLYGCYLIAARGVLLVFLMLVSALAFASYLVPQLSDGEYGWKTWWKSLVNASVFGPLLMILLYANLVILSPISEKMQGRSFANVLSNPSVMQQAGNDWQVIIVFIFGIGMLYASLKVANSFAGKIAGFSTASMLTGVPLVGAARLGGLVGRSTIGRWSAGKHAELAKKENKTLADQVALRALNWGKKGSYDLAKQVGIAGALSKLNAPKFGDSWGKGGYEGVKKRQAEHAAHVAAENSESQTAAKARGEAKGRAQQAEVVKEQLAALEKQIETEKQQIGAVVANEVARGQFGAPPKSTAPSAEQIARDAAAERVRSETRDRQQIQGEGKARIDRARDVAAEKAVQQSLETPDSLKDLEDKAQSLRKTLEALKDKSSDIKSLPDEHRKAIEATVAHTQHAAHEAEQRFAESVARWTPGTLFGDKKAVKGVEEALKSHAKKDRWKDVIAGIKNEIEGGDGHAKGKKEEKKEENKKAAPASGGGDHH